jgi:hypothetical protein
MSNRPNPRRYRPRGAMTPAGERTLLGDLLTVFEQHPEPAPWREAARTAEAAVPSWLLDQQRAAQAETPRLFQAIVASVRPSRDAGVPEPPLTLEPEPWRAAVISAGLTRALAQHPCNHAARLDRPIVVFLAARLATCAPCAPKFKALLVAQERRARTGTDRQCDWCLRDVPENRFTPHVVQAGQVVLHGDACPDCHARMADRAA